MTSINEPASDITTKSSQTLSNLTQVPSSNQFADFMESNNFIARLAFIVFVIFVLIILTQFILRIIVYIYSPKQDIILLP